MAIVVPALARGNAHSSLQAALRVNHQHNLINSVLGDPTIADSILDRLVDNAHRV
jgi:hypothetical protein